jgi:hypothetical protein
VDAVTAEASRFSSQTTTTWEILAEGADEGADEDAAVRPAVGPALTATAEEAGLPGGVVA